MSIHRKLNELRTWSNIDVTDTDVRDNLDDLIDSDLEKSSPEVLKGINGRYSPFKKHFSELGRVHIDLFKTERKLAHTANVALAAVKFKKLLKKNNR
tara:strand:- start:30 stop:320 length:291 start_codon:yes stop_codon:yes gene_type:complete